MGRRTWPSVLLLLALVIAAIGWLLTRDTGPVVAPIDDPPLSLQWSTGRWQRYRVQLDSSVMIGAAKDQATRVRLGGLLDFSPLQVETNEVLVALRLTDAQLHVDDVLDTNASRRLDGLFRARFTNSGMPISFEFSSQHSADDRQILENLVRTFQIDLRADSTWIVTEPHPSGTYAASYTWTDRSHLDKAKLHYQDQTEGTELTSTERISINAGRNWLASMTVHETVRTSDQPELVFEITNDASLKFLGDTPTSARFTPVELCFAATQPPPESSSGSGPGRAAILSSEQAESQLRSLLAGLDGTTKGRILWIHKLRDLLKSSPELAFTLVAAMDNEEHSDRTRSDLYLVLELAGTTEAQSALVSVIEKQDGKTLDGLRALVALGAVATPDAASLQALWSVMQAGPKDGDRQLADTATLALGTVGNSLRTAPSAAYSSLRNGLVAAARASMDPRQRATLLLAIGNTHDPDLCEEVGSYLADDSSKVRKAAARAAGQVGPAALGDMLMASLGLEEHSTVRASIVESLVGWESPPAQAMASIRVATRKESDEAAQYQMVRMLAKHHADLPANLEVLRELLRSASSERIRREAAEALQAAK